MIKKLQNHQQLTQKLAKLKAKLNLLPAKWVLSAMTTLLIVMLGFGWYLSQNKNEVPSKTPPLYEVEIYQVGSAPHVKTTAQVEKGNVITIIAQSSGIVRKIQVKEGQKVWAGQTLISLASNYQGGNAASLQRQIVQKQNQLTNETYQDQKQSLNTQIQIAEKSAENSDQLRRMSQSAADDATELIRLNEALLDQLEADIAILEANNTNGSQDDLIFQTKSSQAQLWAGLNQIKASSRQSRYQGSEDQPPAELANLQKTITLQQLKIQEKSLDLGKEISDLQLRLAKVSEATMYPATPVAGMVQQINVQIGDMVQPGQVLATISTTNQATNLITYVSSDIALNLTPGEPALVKLANEVIQLYPSFVSSEATNNGQHLVKLILPEDKNSQVSDAQTIEVQLPIGYADTSALNPYLPIDAVYQTTQQAYVYVVSNDTAKAKTIELGPVYGNYVSVLSGLEDQDQVILNRQVIDGDQIIVKNTTVQN